MENKEAKHYLLKVEEEERNLDEKLKSLTSIAENKRKIMNALHEYNDIKDATQIVLGQLANLHGVTIFGNSATVNDDGHYFDYLTKCDTDRECPDTKYCYNNVCLDCYNCTKIHQYSEIRCPKLRKDCGECLPGYSGKFYFASGYRWCYRVTTAQPQRMNYTNIQNMNGINSGYSCNNSQLAPPPYNEDDHQIDDNSSIACSFQLRIIEHSENDKQKAVPYIVENIRNENSENIQLNVQHNVNAEIFPYTPVLNDIHDENTTPSEWTPGLNYGNDTENDQTVQVNDFEKDNPPRKKRKLSDDSNDGSFSKKKDSKSV
ncbi:hypothetical protein PGB90_000802 [Kerria lacca]